MSIARHSLGVAMPGPIGNEALREEIARRAYSKFCERGCIHGGDVDDWITAEREVLADVTPAERSKNTSDASSRRQKRRNQR